mmetsp:Transcript_38389/g.83505  ORF Transcript_38389/g.83505 Transcript_38389/m.83505 type:complete len:802 (-) Transcript_38389:1149-3554(-)
MNSQTVSGAGQHDDKKGQRPWWAALQQRNGAEKRPPRFVLNPQNAIGKFRLPKHIENIQQTGEKFQARVQEVATGVPHAVGQAWQNLHTAWKEHTARSKGHVLRRFVYREGRAVPAKHPMDMLASLTLNNMMKAGSVILNPGPMLAALPESEKPATKPDTSGDQPFPKKEPVPDYPRRDTDYQNETLIEFENSPHLDATRVTVNTVDKEDLLLELCSALSSLGLMVIAADIKTANGRCVDSFLIKNHNGDKVREQQWHLVRTRLLASCRRRGGKGWREKDRRLREIFSMIDSKRNGHINQEDVTRYARKLRLPPAFVADFVQEHDSMDDDKLSFEEFAASVRAKEAMLYTVFDQIDTGQYGYVSRRHLESGLRNVEVRTGRYGKRKKVSAAGVVKMMNLLGNRKHIVREEFRDLLIMLPAKELVTVTPYYMKVGLDIGRMAPPDRRKDGPPWGHFVAGGLAGVVSKTLSSPLHVISIQIATTSVATAGAGSGALGSLTAAMMHIYKSDGVGGFWRGNMTNAVSSAPGKAIDFFSYALLKKVLTKGEREPNDMERFVAGAVAGMASDGILYPLELISTRMAVSKHANAFVAAQTILREEGIKGFYSGLGSALVGVIPYAGVSFGMYDMLSTAYRKRAGVDSAGILPTFCCGLASGWAASTLSFPLYNVTIRLQAQSASSAAGTVMYKGMMDAFRKILAAQGIRGLYTGYVPASLKMIPMSGASFTTYELVKQFLKDADRKARAHHDHDHDDDQDDHHVQHPPLLIEALSEEPTPAAAAAAALDPPAPPAETPKGEQAQAPSA